MTEPNGLPAARSGRPLRVGVVDEPELVVRGVHAMLSPYADRVRLAGPDGDPAGQVVGLDVVLCDPFPVPPAARGSHDGGLDRIVTLAPARVLVFSWHTHPVGVRQALGAGAHGYLGKTATGPELLAALEAVVRGERPTPDLPVQRAAVGFPGLSTRESEVLALICEGLSNQEVADRLFVSVNSVKTYIRQVYGKTGVTRRTQAVAWAHRHGWLG
ncbi:DNA-binding response regulator [Nocardioides sp. OK12]|uniref:response regulator transcription factor n=1 Tax=Nocardioides sp. OK12 TaxID=2758661 RepID=UPI0021C299B4|nr:response regulator transcription factor [Nocardioides sp. OK12]GHJ60093.1 DNA-binding response regulator [Nocardioides sp. OK12]